MILARAWWRILCPCSESRWHQGMHLVVSSHSEACSCSSLEVRVAFCFHSMAKKRWLFYNVHWIAWLEDTVFCPEAWKKSYSFCTSSFTRPFMGGLHMLYGMGHIAHQSKNYTASNATSCSREITAFSYYLWLFHTSICQCLNDSKWCTLEGTHESTRTGTAAKNDLLKLE